MEQDVWEEIYATARMPVSACQGACAERLDVVLELIDYLIANLGGDSPGKRT